MKWNKLQTISSEEYRCGYCGNVVASSQGYFVNSTIKIHICPHCECPTYFNHGTQIPGVAPGNEVTHLPENIDLLYKEARNCVSVSSHTAAVLVCRKLLMNIAVAQDAEEGKSFIFYVDYLADQGYVPPNGRGWVDHIRKKGNEANHEIVLIEKEDAEELILFAEMLLTTEAVAKDTIARNINKTAILDLESI